MSDAPTDDEILALAARAYPGASELDVHVYKVFYMHYRARIRYRSRRGVRCALDVAGEDDATARRKLAVTLKRDGGHPMSNSPTAVFGYGVWVSDADVDPDALLTSLARLGESSIDALDISTVSAMLFAIARRYDIQLNDTFGSAPSYLFHVGECWSADREGVRVPLPSTLSPRAQDPATWAPRLVILGKTPEAVGWWLFADDK